MRRKLGAPRTAGVIAEDFEAAAVDFADSAAGSGSADSDPVVAQTDSTLAVDRRAVQSAAPSRFQFACRAGPCQTYPSTDPK